MDPSKSLKTAVLKDEMGYLCEELGDPGRYIPSLRSKNLLDTRDTEQIRGQSTSAQKVEVLVDIIISRQGHSSEHPLDILINELKKQRVQVHIARRLQRTLKKKQKETESTSSATGAGARPAAYEVLMSMKQQQSFERHQSYPTMSAHSEPKFTSNTDFPDGRGSHTNAEPHSYEEHSYEVNPSVGLIPGAPPPLTTSYVTETSSATSFDTEHGALPGTPPPTSNQQFADGPGTPPRGSQPTLAEGLQYMSLNDHGGMNGDFGAGGQSTHGYSSLDTESSMLSSYTTVTDASDIEKDKLRAQVQELLMLLEQERNRSMTLETHLSSAKQELVHARQELASLKQAKFASDGIPTRDPQVRPGTLFPAYQDPMPRYYRQLSPARADSGGHGRQSMDNLSVQSANSSTSENSQQGSYSHNSSVASTPRTAQMQSYV